MPLLKSLWECFAAFRRPKPDRQKSSTSLPRKPAASQRPTAAGPLFGFPAFTFADHRRLLEEFLMRSTIHSAPDGHIIVTVTPKGWDEWVNLENDAFIRELFR